MEFVLVFDLWSGFVSLHVSLSLYLSLSLSFFGQVMPLHQSYQVPQLVTVGAVVGARSHHGHPGAPAIGLLQGELGPEQWARTDLPKQNPFSTPAC